MAHDEALGKVMQHLLKDDTQVYKQFVENESFPQIRWRHGLSDHTRPSRLTGSGDERHA
jgi:hypothetical protein